MNLLFICTDNQVRSRTAEVIYSDSPIYQFKSGGTMHKAKVKVSSELIHWADLIFVMEDEHEEYLSEEFGMK